MKILLEIVIEESKEVHPFSGSRFRASANVIQAFRTPVEYPSMFARHETTKVHLWELCYSDEIFHESRMLDDLQAAQAKGEIKKYIKRDMLHALISAMYAMEHPFYAEVHRLVQKRNQSDRFEQRYSGGEESPA